MLSVLNTLKLATVSESASRLRWPKPFVTLRQQALQDSFERINTRPDEAGWVGNRTTEQGHLLDCYFLSALDAIFLNKAATQAVMQQVRQLSPDTFLVKRGDGSVTLVDLKRLPAFPNLVRAPLGYRVLEAAYRDYPLHRLAPGESTFKAGGFSVDVFEELLRDLPGHQAIQLTTGNQTDPLSHLGTGIGNQIAGLLQQLADPRQSSKPLLTATTMHPTGTSPHQLSRKRYRSGGGGVDQRYRVYQDKTGREWKYSHVYSVTHVQRNKRGDLQITLEDPYLAVGEKQARTVVNLLDFLAIFTRVDGMVV